MQIIRATEKNLDGLVTLFNGYMMFYRQASNPESYRRFLKERLINDEAIVFLAMEGDDTPMGFTLIYPSFSSVSQGRIYVLNDLFVHENHRQKGVATALLDAAAHFGRSNGGIRLTLETELTNLNAQKLYEKEGWIRNDDHYFYDLEL